MALKITSFTDIVEHAHANTLIVLDIDETVLKFTDGFGNQTWWQDVFNSHFTRLQDFDAADSASLADWTVGAQERAVEHTDQYGLNRLLTEAREMKNPIIALTARSSKLAKITTEHIAALEIAFDDLSVDESVCFNRDGIFYAGDESKADVLIRIYEYLQQKNIINIVRIVFVDDKERHTNDVLTAFDSTPISIHCYLADLL